MENTEIQQTPVAEKKDLIISRESLENLTETRKWTMFFAILGFIAIGFMALGAIIFGMIAAVGGSFGGFREASFLGIFSIVYIILGALYFFPVLYLLKFSTHMKKAIDFENQNDLLLAFQNLKSHYKFVGILTIVIIGLYIIGIFGFILFGLSNIF